MLCTHGRKSGVNTWYPRVRAAEFQVSLSHSSPEYTLQKVRCHSVTVPQSTHCRKSGVTSVTVPPEYTLQKVRCHSVTVPQSTHCRKSGVTSVTPFSVYTSQKGVAAVHTQTPRVQTAESQVLTSSSTHGSIPGKAESHTVPRVGTAGVNPLTQSSLRIHCIKSLVKQPHTVPLSHNAEIPVLLVQHKVPREHSVGSQV